LRCVGPFPSHETGRKFSATTALGMTETMSGSSEALSTVFSLLRRVSPAPQTGGQTVPGVADADDVVDITERELEELVGENAPRVGEAKQAVVGEDGPQAHGPRMQYGLMAQGTETGMAVHNFNLLADADVAEDGEEGEDGRESCLAVDGPEGDVVDLEAVCEVPYPRATGIGVSDDDHLVAAIDEFLAELVDIRII
jgi:hypothetical protein